MVALCGRDWLAWAYRSYWTTRTWRKHGSDRSRSYGSARQHGCSGLDWPHRCGRWDWSARLNRCSGKYRTPGFNRCPGSNRSDRKHRVIWRDRGDRGHGNGRSNWRHRCYGRNWADRRDGGKWSRPLSQDPILHRIGNLYTDHRDDVRRSRVSRWQWRQRRHGRDRGWSGCSWRIGRRGCLRQEENHFSILRCHRHGWCCRSGRRVRRCWRSRRNDIVWGSCLGCGRERWGCRSGDHATIHCGQYLWWRSADRGRSRYCGAIRNGGGRNVISSPFGRYGRRFGFRARRSTPPHHYGIGRQLWHRVWRRSWRFCGWGKPSGTGWPGRAGWPRHGSRVPIGGDHRAFRLPIWDQHHPSAGQCERVGQSRPRLDGRLQRNGA